MYIYIHIHIRTYTRIYMCIYIYTYIYICREREVYIRIYQQRVLAETVRILNYGSPLQLMLHFGMGISPYCSFWFSPMLVIQNDLTWLISPQLKVFCAVPAISQPRGVAEHFSWLKVMAALFFGGKKATNTPVVLHIYVPCQEWSNNVEHGQTLNQTKKDVVAPF